MSTLSFWRFVESISMEIGIIRATMYIGINATFELDDSRNTSVSDLGVRACDGNDARLWIQSLDCICTLEALYFIHVIGVWLPVTVFVG